MRNTKVALSRYRQKVRRFDYAPSATALEIINRHLAEQPNATIQGVLDQLITAGHRITTEGSNK